MFRFFSGNNLFIINGVSYVKYIVKEEKTKSGFLSINNNLIISF